MPQTYVNGDYTTGKIIEIGGRYASQHAPPQQGRSQPLWGRQADMRDEHSVSGSIELVLAQIARVVGRRTLRLVVIAGFAVSLAACDKCSVPTWRHDTPAAPQSCHDDPPM